MPEYATYVFDLDGTLLDTARAKSEAFYRAGLRYGVEAGSLLLQIHHTAGSAPRRDQVARWAREYFGDSAGDFIDDVMAQISETLDGVYASAPEVPGARAYLDSVPNRVCVSGIEAPELDAILADRGFTFRAVASGPKADVFRRLIADGSITLPAVYYGDTEDDWRSATEAGLDFVLVLHGSEWASPPPDIQAVRDFCDLLPEPQPTRYRVDRDGFVEVAGERQYVGRMLAGAEVTL